MSARGLTPRFPTLGLARAVLVAAIDDAIRENEEREEASSAIAEAVADAIVVNNEEVSRQLAAVLERFERDRDFPRS